MAFGIQLFSKRRKIKALAQADELERLRAENAAMRSALERIWRMLVGNNAALWELPEDVCTTMVHTGQKAHQVMTRRRLNDDGR